MKDEATPGCMGCGLPIADPNAPARFCSQACFDTLLRKVHANWNQRYAEAKARAAAPAVEVVRVRKPLSVIMRARPRPTLAVRPLGGDAA